MRRRGQVLDRPSLCRIMWIRAGLALAIAAIVPTLYHWRPKKCRSKTLPPSQERVVILGASSLDGIGAAVARQCLARGCSNLMLVARREEALKLVKKTLIHEQKDPAARASAEAIELFVADCSNVHDVFRLQTWIAQGRSLGFSPKNLADLIHFILCLVPCGPSPCSA